MEFSPPLGATIEESHNFMITELPDTTGVALHQQTELLGKENASLKKEARTSLFRNAFSVSKNSVLNLCCAEKVLSGERNRNNFSISFS